MGWPFHQVRGKRSWDSGSQLMRITWFQFPWRHVENALKGLRGRGSSALARGCAIRSPRYMPDAGDFDLLTLRQLKLVADAAPQPYRIRVQVDAVNTRETSQGKPFIEVKLTDGTELMTWRVFDGNPLY